MISEEEMRSRPGEPKRLPGGIAQDWVSGLAYRMQAVLLSSMRGCDGKGKDDPSKPLIRHYRTFVLKPAEEGWKDNPQNSYYVRLSTEGFEEAARLFFRDLDSYPMHWLTHFAYSAEILGYFHPLPGVRDEFEWFYERLVHKLHLQPETKEACQWRLRDGSRTEEEDQQ